eukprot:gene2048-5118_t
MCEDYENYENSEIFESESDIIVDYNLVRIAPHDECTEFLMNTNWEMLGFMVFCDDKRILDYFEIISEYNGKGFATELITRLTDYDYIEKVSSAPNMNISRLVKEELRVDKEHYDALKNYMFYDSGTPNKSTGKG